MAPVGIVVEESQTATECTASSDQADSQSAEGDLKIVALQAVVTDLAGSTGSWPGHPWCVHSQIVAREARLCRSVRSRASHGW